MITAKTELELLHLWIRYCDTWMWTGQKEGKTNKGRREKVILVLAIATKWSGGGDLSHMNNIQLMRSMTLAFVGIHTLIDSNLVDQACKSLGFTWKWVILIIDFLCNCSLKSLSFFFSNCLFVLSPLQVWDLAGELSPKDPRCPHSFDITLKLF